MVQGLLLAMIAGSFVGLQNIFNSKVQARAGMWVTNALVLGLGFLASLIFGLLMEGKSMFALSDARPWYWFSGLLGIGVVTCTVQGIRRLGPTYAVSIALASQLACALVMDSLGLFGLRQVPFTPKQLLGVLVIVIGMLLFKFGGARGDGAVSGEAVAGDAAVSRPQ